MPILRTPDERFRDPMVVIRDAGHFPLAFLTAHPRP